MGATAKTKSKTPKKPRGSATPLTRWGVRALVALVLGASLGAGAGVFTVNKLEPGQGTGVDSLAVMLDSIAKGAVPAEDTGKSKTSGGSAAASENATSPAAERVPVPSLVNLEEGAARNALLDAGLQVGEIQFQRSPKPAGTVLASRPQAGTAVSPDTPVSLLLSDGRPDGPDSLSFDAPLPDSVGIDSLSAGPMLPAAPDSLAAGSIVDPDSSSRLLRPITP